MKLRPSLPADEAYAWRVGRRFFIGWTRSGVVKTAWCLSGAKLFHSLKDAEWAISLRRHYRLPRAGFELVEVSVVTPERATGGVN